MSLRRVLLPCAGLLVLAACASFDRDPADSDAAITERVERSLLQGDFTDVFEIDVSTEDGVVRLGGQVTSETEVERAVERARRVEGVRRVEESLTVVPQDPDRLPALDDSLGTPF